MPLVKVYKTSYIAFTPEHRLEMDVPGNLHPAHRVGYFVRRDVTVPGPRGTTYRARCSCGAKPPDDSLWYQTKPKARKMWWLSVHLNEVQIQRTFPGTEEVSDA